MTSHILICGWPEAEDREGRWTAKHCLPSRKRRGLAQLHSERGNSPKLPGYRALRSGQAIGFLGCSLDSSRAGVMANHILPAFNFSGALPRWSFPRVKPAKQSRGVSLVRSSPFLPWVAAHVRQRSEGNLSWVTRNVSRVAKCL